MPDSSDMSVRLTRTEAAAAVQDAGWRFLEWTFKAYVPVPSHPLALDVAQLAVTACGPDADAHLAVQIGAGRVDLTLVDSDVGRVTARDASLALDVTTALADRGFETRGLPDGAPRGVQGFEIAIDALDIPRIRPFWKAVLGYTDETGNAEADAAVVDPQHVLPSIWFQQMDEPRPQRNRIHFDVLVPHDEAEARIKAALDAGGVLVSDKEARAFWILADAEGNEICVCTWQDRE
jgi:4a-hydroxytetrahydrobiopterin dehydratase